MISLKVSPRSHERSYEKMESEAVITKHRLLAIVRLSLELVILALFWCIAHLVCCLPARRQTSHPSPSFPLTRPPLTDAAQLFHR